MTRKRTKINYAEHDLSDEEVQERPGKGSKMPANRVATGRRRTKGGLKDLPNMPLDIIFEICFHLQLQDVLNLSRTTRAFHTVLMRRSTAYIWKAANDQTEDLPKCPSWMSEPQHADLLFSSHCHSCLKDKVREPLWELSVRYCANCKDSQLVTLNYDLKILAGLSTTYGIPAELIMNDLLNWTPGVRRQRLYHLPQMKEFLEKWTAVSTAPDDTPASGDGSPLEDPSSTTDKAFNFHHYKAFTAKQKEFLCSWKDNVHQRREYATECLAWSDINAQARAEIRTGKRESRLESVVEKLEELDYKEELNLIARGGYRVLTANAYVRQPNKLTDKAWRKMKDEVVAIMEGVRTQHRENNQKQAFVTRLNTLTTMLHDWDVKSLPRSTLSRCIPNAGDLAVMPEVRPLMEAPYTESVDLHILNARMPRLVQQWQENVKSELRKLAEESLKSLQIPDDIERLDLAVVFFRCNACSSILEFPSAMAHECLRRNRFWGRSVANSFEGQVSAHMKRSPWSTDRLECEKSLLRLQPLLKACGRDPAYTTKKNMDDLDERFYKAADSNGKKLIYSWRYALQDSLSPLPLPQDVWNVVDAAEREKVNELERLRRHKVLRSFHDAPMWACSLCADRDGDVLMKAKEHVQTRHSKEDSSLESGDIYILPRFTGRHAVPESVLLIPDSLPTEKLTRNDEVLLETGRAAYFKSWVCI